MKPLAHWLNDAIENPVQRLQTGYLEMDARTGGGLVQGTLVVLAALTGCGKSTIALNLLVTMAAKDTPGALVTLEDTGKMVAGKVLSLWSGVPLDRISGTLSDSKRADLEAARAALARLPIHISETHDLNALRAEISKAAANGAKFIVVDQLHHVTVNPPMSNKYERVSHVTRELQTMARDNGVVLLVLHQVNRKAHDEGIELHHLRDSGTIEQDARMVLLVTECQRDTDPTRPAVLTLKVAKNSHGPAGGEFKLLARFDCARIETYTGSRE